MRLSRTSRGLKSTQNPIPSCLPSPAGAFLVTVQGNHKIFNLTILYRCSRGWKWKRNGCRTERVVVPKWHWLSAGDPHCFALPGASPHQSLHQSRSRVGQPVTWFWDGQQGWSNLGTPSCTHNPSWISSWSHAFSSRELEMLSSASLAGGKKPGEWAPESGQAVYEGTETKI